LTAPGSHEPVWRKASASNGSSGNCVELAKLPTGMIAVRDSKNPDGPRLLFTDGEWRAFVDGMSKGEFDHLLSALPSGGEQAR
jgi:hypothetical protein